MSKSDKSNKDKQKALKELIELIFDNIKYREKLKGLNYEDILLTENELVKKWVEVKSIKANNAWNTYKY